MKNIITGILAILLLALDACTGSGSEFTGKWKQLKGSMFIRENAILEIDKDGDQFNLIRENPHTIMTTLQYNKTSDCLTGDIEGRALTIKYDKATGHIIIAPRSMGFMDTAIELEKAN